MLEKTFVDFISNLYECMEFLHYWCQLFATQCIVKAFTYLV